MSRSHRILVVDDEEAIRRIAMLGLRHAGYDVVATGDPWEALEALGDPGAAVDLVLLDVSMPVMSGREVYRRVREIWDGPVLFHSGYRSENVLTDELDDARTGFLAKPWTLAELTAGVAAMLG